MSIKEKIRRTEIIAVYAAKMLTMPMGTEYEFKGKRVNRFEYTCSVMHGMLPMLKH